MLHVVREQTFQGGSSLSISSTWYSIGHAAPLRLHLLGTGLGQHNLNLHWRRQAAIACSVCSTSIETSAVLPWKRGGLACTSSTLKENSSGNGRPRVNVPSFRRPHSLLLMKYAPEGLKDDLSLFIGEVHRWALNLCGWYSICCSPHY